MRKPHNRHGEMLRYFVGLLVLGCRCHLETIHERMAHAVKGRLQKLLVYQAHQIEILRTFTFRVIVKLRLRDRQQRALLGQRQAW